MKITRFTKILLAGSLVAASLATSSFGAVLTINSPGVVGTVAGQPFAPNLANEIVAAQFLLNLPTNSGLVVGPFSLITPAYQTGANNYSGTLLNGVQGLTNYGVSGYDWGFAKYDGPNAGSVLFYLGGAVASTIVPLLSNDIWVNGEGQGYGISHLSVFNSRNQDTPGAPDGGSTVVLLGLSLFVLTFFARRRLA